MGHVPVPYQTGNEYFCGFVVNNEQLYTREFILLVGILQSEFIRVPLRTLPVRIIIALKPPALFC